MSDEVVDEHFVPIRGLDLTTYLESGDVNGVHHLIRYKWALRCLADRPGVERLVDLGSGAGYGSYAIARAFPGTQVLGVDYDARAVEQARRTYSLPNLAFQTGDGRLWRETIGTAPFDCVVCFDVIEHIPHRELFLENVVRHLRPGGCMLFSTPCGHPANVLQPEWSFHMVEYTASSLYDLLRRYFGVVRRPDGGTLPHLEVFDELKGSGVSYLLLMNPVLCEEPVRVENPYRGASEGPPS
jgi:SAM-dependent methyltransferase